MLIPENPFTEWELLYSALRVCNAPPEVASSIANMVTRELHTLSPEEDIELANKIRDWVAEDQESSTLIVKEVMDKHHLILVQGNNMNMVKGIILKGGRP